VDSIARGGCPHDAVNRAKTFEQLLTLKPERNDLKNAVLYPVKGLTLAKGLAKIEVVWRHLERAFGVGEISRRV
jgi:hypothetical protein